MANETILLSIDKKFALTVEEAAAYTGIGQNTLYDLMKREGNKFCCKTGERKCIIIRHKLEEFLDSHFDLTA